MRGMQISSVGLPGGTRNRVAKRHDRIHVQAQLPIVRTFPKAAIQAEAHDCDRA